MENNELTHHGVKGMKWGVRRTPAQLGHKTPNKRKSSSGLSFFKKKKPAAKSAPSSKKGKTPEEIEAKKKAKIEEQKKKILASRSPKELYKNAHLFTTQELQTAYNRLQLEKNIQSLSPKEVNKGEEILKKTANMGNNISDAVTGGSKAYNSVARIYNAFSGSEKKLPIIDMGDGKKKDKSKKNNDDGDDDTPNTSTKKTKTKTKAETKAEDPDDVSDAGGEKTESTFKSKKKKETVIDAEWEEVVDNIADTVDKKGADYMERFLDKTVDRLADGGSVLLLK